MSGLFVNYFECNFIKYQYSLHKLEYRDYDTKEKYFNLKDSHLDFAFIRHEDIIFYWALAENSIDTLRGQDKVINASENPSIFSKVFENALIYQLKKTNLYNIRHDPYSHIWRITKEKDLLDHKIEGLVLYRQICINTYYRLLDGKISFGLVISTDLEHKFLWGRREFERRGIDTRKLSCENDTIFPNSHAIKHFLTARGFESEYITHLRLINSNQKEMELIFKFSDWIDKNKSSIFLPDCNELTSISKRYLPAYGITQEVLKNPKRYYFNGQPNEQIGLSYDQQVKKYKPYSFELFDSKTIVIGVLCPQQFEGVIEGFINKLENILRNDLHIRKIKFNICFTSGLDVNSYCDKLYNQDLLSSNIVIIIVTEEQKDLPPNSSPYFICKAKYLGNGIPTQDVQIKNVKNPNNYILNNISLNIYAKLGGTAWTLEKEDKRKEELIIGIGSSTDRDGKHILGIAHIFNSDGRYLVGDCTPLSNFDNYVDNLKRYLYQALTNTIENHIDKRQEFRLIFHLFKSASSRYEIKAINDVINQFNQYSFKYALLHLGYGHNFRLYNDDGKQQIARGMYVKLDNNSGLLHFITDSPLPLFIQLDKRSTFQDLYYLSEQIFWFSNLSHRSYKPAKKTVTITYPSLMTSMTEKLKQVNGWDYDRLKNVSEKLWFI